MYRIASLPALVALVPLAAFLAVCAPRPSLSPPAAVPEPEPEAVAADAERPTDPLPAAPETRGTAASATRAASARTVVASPRVRPLPSAAERSSGLVELRRGAQHRASGDWRAAAESFRVAAGALPLIDDWANLLAAEMAGRTGDTAAVSRVLAAADPLRSREWGWRAAEIAYLTAGDSAAAIRFLEGSAQVVSEPGRRAEIFRRLGDLQLRRGNAAGAVASYRRVMEIAPASVSAREAAAAMGPLERPASDRLLEGRVWVRHGNVDRGVAGVEAFLAGARVAAAEQAEVRLEAGRALFNARRYRDAERFLNAAAREPTAAPAVAAEALFLAARSQFRDGRTDLARNTFIATADRFPREQAAAQALYILGDLEQDAGRLSAAREFFRRAASAHPQTQEAVLAAVRHAGMYILAGDPATAATLLDDVVGRRTEDRHSAQALYWSGRAHAAAGRSAVARERFETARRIDPVSYYGQLAASRLGSSLADIRLVDSPLDDRLTAAAVEAALLRVEILREAGLTDLATLEMEFARRELEPFPGALYLIAEAHHARGAPVAGILLGREIQRAEGSWNDRLLRIVFPFPHRELIEAESRRNGLDPFMVAGLIRQESMFNEIAVSPAGAIGLMQVMPATGRMLARRAGVSNFDPAMLRRPELNVRLGTLFLADQLRRSGNRTEAFAAYNAGPSRAARWRQYPEYRDEELFAERIPFTETRDYVKILDFNTRVYRMLYGG